jgi:hypothetical protein
MNKKLQMLVEEFSHELQERFPGVSLEVYPRHRKQAYVYVMPPEKSVWDGEGIWDLLNSMAEKETDTLVETGYSIILLPRFRQPPVVDMARLRERAAQWKIDAQSEA